MAKHKRRVMAIPGQSQFIHRGWGEKCDSPTASIMGETYTPQSTQFGMIRPPRSEK